MTALQQAVQQWVAVQRTGCQAFVEKFKLVGQIANRGDFNHARAPFEGVQITQQVFYFEGIFRFILPTCQSAGRAFDDIEAFLQEDFQQLGVVLTDGFNCRLDRF